MSKTDTTFQQAMQASGIVCKDQIIADGKLRKFSNNGHGRKSAWYTLHSHGGAFGDWKLGVKEKWTAPKELTPMASVHSLVPRPQEPETSYEEEKRIQQDEAYKQASGWWPTYAPFGQSAYLDKKKVKSYGVRFGSDFMAVPLLDADDKLWSLQFIYHDGTKRFLKGGRTTGCFHVMGHLPSAQQAFVCEGFATGASVFEALKLPTVVAFHAGNLDPVISELKAKYPNLVLTIIGDEDRWSQVNTGRLKAEEAARKYGCRVVFPEFADIKGAPTDFNDLHVLEGLDVVREQLENLEHLPLPPQAPQPPEPQTTSDEETLLRLATLAPLEYGRCRKEEAKRLQIKQAILDDEVKKRRKQETSVNDQTGMFPDEEIWPDPVDPAEVLDELTGLFKRFAVLPIHTDTALPLWVAFTWCIDSVNVAPILAICSPEKQCGKTTVLSLVQALSKRALSTSNITSSALFRTVQAFKPTLLIDEADTFIRSSEELRGIINSGHTRSTAFVIRTSGDTHEPRRLSTWGAKAIALIGQLPDTLHDRSIVVVLRRKLIGESAEKLRHVDDGFFEPIRRKLKRFAHDFGESIRTARPLHPGDISDRAADNWEPLLAIAQAAGLAWEMKAMEAACALSARPKDATSIGTELLMDIQSILTTIEGDKISSAALITELCKDEERPWATFDRGSMITPSQVAKILKQYGIVSQKMRNGLSTIRGYHRSQFEDALLRYIPS